MGERREDHDTAVFAVETLRRWWLRMGKAAYPQAKRLPITADGGDSNGSRNRLWKVELQKFADATGLRVSVCHFPPGTSKWNKIEHRMFCHINENWRGRPLVSRQVVVNLIGHTSTKSGSPIDKAHIEIRFHHFASATITAAQRRQCDPGATRPPDATHTQRAE